MTPSGAAASDIPSLALFVVSGGSGPVSGLHRFTRHGRTWQGHHLAQVDGLAALARHPVLPVVYGVSGTTATGSLHAWEIRADDARYLGGRSTGGQEPCHVTIDPAGCWGVVTNYASGSLAVFGLGADGAVISGPQLLRLTGTGADPDRQAGSHPHQGVLDGGRLHVVDLGADVVRTVVVEADENAGWAARELAVRAVPPGTGPRHLVVLPDGALVVSGELASAVLLGPMTGPGGDWVVAPSTTRGVRHDGPRNYPGDVQRSPDGRWVYLANRGRDTISSFAVRDGTLRHVAEVDAGVRWPQHLQVVGKELFVAGRDDSHVVALPLTAGVPGTPREQFSCEAPSWLLPEPPTEVQTRPERWTSTTESV